MKGVLKGLLVGAIAAAAIAGVAHAGTTGTEFQSVYDTLVGWAQGTLGKVISLVMIMVGIVAGVARQNLMAFAVGIAAGLGLYTAPFIVDNVVSATLPVQAAAATAVQTVAPLI
jgi:conjugal transfer pilus assembly protein TraA